MTKAFKLKGVNGLPSMGVAYCTKCSGETCFFPCDVPAPKFCAECVPEDYWGTPPGPPRPSSDRGEKRKGDGSL